jgi:tetratricopeptide (TPR) repeat protein
MRMLSLTVMSKRHKRVDVAFRYRIVIHRAFQNETPTRLSSCRPLVTTHPKVSSFCQPHLDSNIMEDTRSSKRLLKKASKYFKIACDCWYSQDYELAQRLLQECVRIREALLGTYHVQTARTYYSMGCSLHGEGKYADALLALRRSLRISTVLEDTVRQRAAITYIQWVLQKWDFSWTLEQIKEYQGHLEDSIRLEHTGDLAVQNGDIPSAVAAFAQSLAMETLAHNHQGNPADVADLHVKLACVTDDESHWETARELYATLWGEDHPSTVRAAHKTKSHPQCGDVASTQRDLSSDYSEFFKRSGIRTTIQQCSGSSCASSESVTSATLLSDEDDEDMRIPLDAAETETHTRVPLYNEDTEYHSWTTMQGDGRISKNRPGTLDTRELISTSPVPVVVSSQTTTKQRKKKIKDDVVVKDGSKPSKGDTIKKKNKGEVKSKVKGSGEGACTSTTDEPILNVKVKKKTKKTAPKSEEKGPSVHKKSKSGTNKPKNNKRISAIVIEGADEGHDDE